MTVAAEMAAGTGGLFFLPFLEQKSQLFTWGMKFTHEQSPCRVRLTAIQEKTNRLLNYT